MGPVVQFILALAVAATSLAGSSLAWPRFTTQARPQLLERVREITLKTDAGQKAAQVLGVTDESKVEPISIGKMVSDGINGVKNTAEKRIQTIIVSNAVNELTRQFDRLSPDQKQYVQQALCKPQETVEQSSVIQ